MFLIKQFLPGALVAAVVAGAVLALAAWLLRRSPLAAGKSWPGAVALGLGYAAGQVTGAGWPALPPSDVTYWLAYFALAVLCAGVVDACVRLPGAVRGAGWTLLCAGCFYLLLRPKFQSGWSGSEGWLWIAGVSLGTVLISWCLERLAKVSPLAISLPLTGVIVAALTSVTLALSGSILLAQMTVVLAAALGTVLVAAWFVPALPVARGAVPVFAVLLVSLWVDGYIYADLPALSLGLLAVSPLLALVPLGSRLSPWKALLIRAALVLLPATAAVIVAVRASPPLEY